MADEGAQVGVGRDAAAGAEGGQRHRARLSLGVEPVESAHQRARHEHRLGPAGGGGQRQQQQQRAAQADNADGGGGQGAAGGGPGAPPQRGQPQRGQQRQRHDHALSQPALHVERQVNQQRHDQRPADQQGVARVAAGAARRQPRAGQRQQRQRQVSQRVVQRRRRRQQVLRRPLGEGRVPGEQQRVIAEQRQRDQRREGCVPCQPRREAPRQQPGRQPPRAQHGVNDRQVKRDRQAHQQPAQPGGQRPAPAARAPQRGEQRQQAAQQRRPRQRQMRQAEQNLEGEAFRDVKLWRRFARQQQQPAQPAAQRQQQQRDEARLAAVDKDGAEAVQGQHQQRAEAHAQQVEHAHQRAGQRGVGGGQQQADRLPRRDIRQEQQRRAGVFLRCVEQVEIPAALRAQAHFPGVAVAVLHAEQEAAEVLRLVGGQPAQPVRDGRERGQQQRQQQRPPPLAPGDAHTAISQAARSARKRCAVRSRWIGVRLA